MEDISVEDIDIPIEGEDLVLKGSIYFSSKTPSEGSWIINMPGLLDHRESYFVKLYSEKFTTEGFYVLSYDYRAHGETAKQTGKNWLKNLSAIFSDFNYVIDWLFKTQKKRLNTNKVYLFGRSLGGAIILTRGFRDERIKKLIALCTRYDYHSVANISFPEEIIKEVSPIYYLEERKSNINRILLSHCEDDPRIPFKNLSFIKNHLNLPDSKVIIYKDGGHSFKNHRDDLFEKCLEFLKN